MAAKKKMPTKKSSAKTLSLRQAQVFINLLGGADNARKAIKAVEAAEKAAKKKAVVRATAAKKAMLTKAAAETTTAKAAATDEHFKSSGMLTHAQVHARAQLLADIGFDPPPRPRGPRPELTAGLVPSPRPRGPKSMPAPKGTQAPPRPRGPRRNRGSKGS
jgi:hypothetical protein